jgi:hypothetical protein
MWPTPSIGPCDEHGAFEAGLVDDRGEVVGPQPLAGVAAGVEWLLGHAVAAVVEGDHPEPCGELAADLARPAQVALGPSPDEQDRGTVRVPPFAGVQRDTPAAAGVLFANRFGRFRLRGLQREIGCHVIPPWSEKGCSFDSCLEARHGSRCRHRREHPTLTAVGGGIHAPPAGRS